MWPECVKDYVRKCGLYGIDLQGRGAWWWAVFFTLPSAANPVEWDAGNTLISEWIMMTMMNLPKPEHLMMMLDNIR